MSEAALRKMVLDKLGPFGLIKRVENPIDPGTPDMAYVLRAGIRGAVQSGWLELKVTDWPARPTTALCIESLTKEQVLWQKAWVAARGRAWTLLRVRRSYLLLDPGLLESIFYRTASAAAVQALATVYNTTELPVGAMLRALTTPSINDGRFMIY
jgi:hypothetical protein